MMLLAEIHIVPVVVLAGCLIAMDTSHCVSNTDIDIEQAIELLSSEDSIVAGKAAFLLGRSKNISELAIRSLVERLGDEREAETFSALVPVSPPTVGDYASDALVRIQRAAVVAPVCEFLADSDSEEARIRAIKTLCRLGQIARTSVRPLTVCAQDKNKRIRFWAIKAIVSVSANQDETIALLQGALRDEGANVKSVVVLGLGRLGPKAATAVPELLPLLDSSALRGIAISADADGANPLCIDVAVTLGRIGTSAKAAIPKLEKMLSNKNHEVRVAAAFAHCRLSGERKPGLEILLEEIEHGHPPAARAAARALGVLKYEQFAEPALGGLKRALKHPDVLVRCSAARSIGEIAPPDLVRVLRPLATDSSGVVQDCVLEVLSEHAIENLDVLDIFVGCLACETGRNCIGMQSRRIAAEALGKMGAHAEIAIPLLRKCAENDEDDAVRKAAKEALQKIVVPAVRVPHENVTRQ